MEVVVLGGDRRAAYLAVRAAALGEQVTAAGFERLEPAPEGLPLGGISALTRAELVILPVPVTADSYSVSTPFGDMTYPLEAVFSAIPRTAKVFGGRVEPAVEAAALRAGIRVRDYYEREEFMIANAVPTAEGVLALAMEQTESTIRGSRVLILGFGRIARACAALFQAVGAEVSTAARRQSDLTTMATLGYRPVDIRHLKDGVAGQDMVINTVPAPILPEPVLRAIPKGCVVIDVASKPGGVDFAAARGLGINAHWALSLPGKVAPKTAGGVIWDTVQVMLREEEGI